MQGQRNEFESNAPRTNENPTEYPEQITDNPLPKSKANPSTVSRVAEETKRIHHHLFILANQGEQGKISDFNIFTRAWASKVDK